MPLPPHHHAGQESSRSPLGRCQEKVTAARRLGGRLSFAETSNSTNPPPTARAAPHQLESRGKRNFHCSQCMEYTHQLHSKWGVLSSGRGQTGRAHSTRLPRFGGTDPALAGVMQRVGRMCCAGLRLRRSLSPLEIRILIIQDSPSTHTQLLFHCKERWGKRGQFSCYFFSHLGKPVNGSVIPKYFLKLKGKFNKTLKLGLKKEKSSRDL